MLAHVCICLCIQAHRHRPAVIVVLSCMPLVSGVSGKCCWQDVWRVDAAHSNTRKLNIINSSTNSALAYLAPFFTQQHALHGSMCYMASSFMANAAHDTKLRGRWFTWPACFTWQHALHGTMLCIADLLCIADFAGVCRDALSQGQPGLTFRADGNSTSVTVGYGAAASEPLLPCSTANATVSPFALQTADSL